MAAAAIDLMGTLLAHPAPGRKLHSENVGFDGEHMLERGRLMFIIALGETVLTTGTAIAAAPKTWLTAVTGAVAFGITAALWALAFGGTDRVVVRYLEETRNPIRAAMLTINSLPVMMLGLILLAVASEQVITHPYGHGSSPLNLLLFGGPLLVIGVQVFYQWKVTRQWPRGRLLTCLALLVAGWVTVSAPPLVSLVLAGAVTGAFVLLDLQEDRHTERA